MLTIELEFLRLSLHRRTSVNQRYMPTCPVRRNGRADSRGGMAAKSESGRAFSLAEKLYRGLHSGRELHCPAHPDVGRSENDERPSALGRTGSDASCPRNVP